jgi:transcriptional regulator with XRE-family HTH domain
MTAREAFGPTLRQQRERRGVTLGSIARETNISAALFAALERNDLSRWPPGIYRRAAFRAYAAAIGLPPEPALVEFGRLFPESGHDPSHSSDAEPAGLRLALLPEPSWKSWVRRGLAATLDSGAVLLMAYAVASLLSVSVWTMAAALGFGYYGLGTICLGRSVGAWYLESGRFSRLTPRTPVRPREMAARPRGPAVGPAEVARARHS